MQDPNARNSEGLTLIHRAVLAGDEELVRILVDSGVNVNLPCKYNSTPLHAAAHRGFINIVEMLLKSKADVHAVNADGDTPLFVAVNARQVDVVQMLLEYGADVNFQGPFKNSALHYAVHQGSVEIVTILLNFGANVNLEECSGHTALDAANFKATAQPSSCNCNDKNHNLLPEECSNVYHQIIVILKKHVIKLKAAVLPVSEKNLHAIHLKKNKSLRHFEEKCREEVKRMKSVKLQCRDTTLYNMFVNQWNSNIVQEENVVQALVMVDHGNFPIYQTLLINCLKRARCIIARQIPAPVSSISVSVNLSRKKKSGGGVVFCLLLVVIVLKVAKSSRNQVQSKPIHVPSLNFTYYDGVYKNYLSDNTKYDLNDLKKKYPFDSTYDSFNKKHYSLNTTYDSFIENYSRNTRNDLLNKKYNRFNATHYPFYKNHYPFYKNHYPFNSTYYP